MSACNSKNSNIYVQYGCGFSAPAGWRNFNASPTLRFERLPIIGKLYTRNFKRFPDNVEYGDIARGVPVETESCAGVYASHILEHFSLEDFNNALNETFRILSPGGIFRLIVPDLYYLADNYVRRCADGDPLASTDFMRSTCLGIERRKKGIAGIAFEALGNSKHLWMWDEYSLYRALNNHGFDKIRRAYFNDCEDPTFKLVEDAGRFASACAIQAAKPYNINN